MIRIEGKAGISATILADSISPEGVRLTTFELTYPRIILAELNTHKMLSKASASSRAIPFDKMVQTLTGMPVRFGQANPGMQDKGVDFNAEVGYWDEPDFFGERVFISYGMPDEAWVKAKASAIEYSEAFYKAGYHKQVYNRLTEPFQMMKTVMTATEWNNFFWLRDDGAADPTLAELARVMREAKNTSVPVHLRPGDWHLPYILSVRYKNADPLVYYIESDHADLDMVDEQGGEWKEVTLEEAKKVSAARCAAVSFRNVDYTLVKSEEVFARLVGDERKHASAFEHQGTPMKSEDSEFGKGNVVNIPYMPWSWEPGISHMDRNGKLWSGNQKGWIQFRKTIDGENKEG